MLGRGAGRRAGKHASWISDPRLEDPHGKAEAGAAGDMPLPPPRHPRGATHVPMPGVSADRPRAPGPASRRDVTRGLGVQPGPGHSECPLCVCYPMADPCRSLSTGTVRHNGERGLSPSWLIRGPVGTGRGCQGACHRPDGWPAAQAQEGLLSSGHRLGTCPTGDMPAPQAQNHQDSS